MRRACRVDNNQKEIVQGLRKVGASVLIISQLKNCFDILVGFEGVNYVVEIKNTRKDKLTQGELKFKNNWKGGDYNIIYSLDEALKLIKYVVQ